MNHLKIIIEKNSKKFQHFEYYYLLIEKVERNLLKNPDISIECCKSLIEGICTTILVSLDSSLSQAKILKDYNLQKIFKEFKEKLAEYNEDFELDFMNGFNHSVKIIGEIRTKRGDVAHGKKAPKEKISSVEFASFISALTSSLLVYCLEYFFQLEFEEEVAYEDNEEFNAFLDENSPLPGKVKFSLALYEQYLEDYRTQLKQFLADEEEISELADEEEISELVDEEETSIDTETKVETSLSDIIERYNEFSLRENSEEVLNKLCDDNELYIDEVLNVIDTYLFDKREPLSSSITKVLKIKPKILDRDEKVKEIKEKIFRYINDYIKGI
ncbi:hypothetical protein [Halarcobacter sp.]|uniref:hypothetical protein n=1 Tax=Halarcobacter sp. TaxID=2321133 RepID=UPI0029F56E2D|nr:hypothetical protein [Halarcobacter sp.]